MEGKKILLVEDDFLNRRLSKKVLLENEYLVFEAKNTKEAIEIITKENIDLVILDINLGENEQDGIALAQRIKEKHTVPFIYLTAYENPDIINKAVSTDPSSYLTKPFKKVELITSVEIAIRQSNHLPTQKATIAVKHQDYTIELQFDEINYIESDGNYLLFHTDCKVYKLRSTIKQILELLPIKNFIQVHRAYIINKSKLEKFNPKSVVVKNVCIPATKNYIDVLFSSQ